MKISPIDIETRKNLDLQTGDTVRVSQKIQDKGKTRLQVFEGFILSRNHGQEAGATFTVRKVVDGVGVERVFPLYSPLIDKIQVTKRSKTRRAKLYFVRRKAVKEVNRRMKMQMVNVGAMTVAETVEPAASEVE